MGVSKKVILNLMNKNNVLWFFLIGMSGLIFTTLFSIGGIFQGIIMYLSALLSFAAFDCYGFKYVLARFQSYNLPSKKIIYAYRIIQFAFKISLCLILFNAENGWLLVILFLMSWWCGVADLLFYYFLKLLDNLKMDKEMPWLYWTLFGLIFKKATLKMLIISSLSVILISIITIILTF